MLLYHYCSPSTLHAILGQGTIRLSSLTQSNDYMEGKLVSAAVARLGARDGLSAEEIRRIQGDLDLIESLYGGLGFCMSREADLLSQWRGYASDGAGFSIGFSKSFLETLAANARAEGRTDVYLAEVRYRSDEHDQLVQPAYEEVKERMRSAEWRTASLRGMAAAASGKSFDDLQKEIFEVNMNISLAALVLLKQLFLLKSEGFSEEREWRLITHYVDRDRDIHGFRPTPDQLIPYRELRMSALDSTAIPELILGPKHRTPETVIRHFLQKMGLSETKVIKSRTSYR